MEHKIYTMPMCEKCKEIKDYLTLVSAVYSEVDLAEDEGVAELRKIYPKLKDKVERTAEGQIPIPLIISMEGDEVMGTAHTLDEVKSLLN